MKVLVMYVDEFSYSPAKKNLEGAAEVKEGNTFNDCIVAFIQVEKSDEEYDVKSREKKLVNHLKWTARKNNCKKIILHSFLPSLNQISLIYKEISTWEARL